MMIVDLRSDTVTKPTPGMMEAMMGGRRGREMMGGGMGMGAPSGGGTKYDESIYFITPPNEKSKEQYKIHPVLISVLVDQGDGPLIAGQPPFVSASPRQLLNMQCTTEPPPLPEDVRAGLPKGVEQLLFQLLVRVG